MLSSSLYAMIKQSKTTSLQKLFDYDCVTLHDFLPVAAPSRYLQHDSEFPEYKKCSANNLSIDLLISKSRSIYVYFICDSKTGYMGCHFLAKPIEATVYSRKPPSKNVIFARFLTFPPPLIFSLYLQGDQLNMAVFSLYIGKSDLLSVHIQRRTLDESLYTRYQNNIAMLNWSPCITGSC